MKAIFSFTVGDNAISRHLLAVCAELKSRGHEVSIVSWGAVPRQNLGIEVNYFPSMRPTKLQDLIFLLKLFWRKQPDLIVSNFGSVNLMLIAGYLLKVPIRVAWYHTLSSQIELDWKKSSIAFRLLKFRKKLIYKLATDFVANSIETASDLCQQYSIDNRNVKILNYTLLGKEKWDKPKLLNGNKKVTFVGRLDDSKGVDVLIDAFRIIHQRDPSTMLVIVGNGVLKSKLEVLAKEYGLADHCIFVGAVPNYEVLEYFESAHVAVVPSRYEAFGIVAIEALMTGTPVVASRTGGLAEIIRDGIDGFLVEPENPVALAEAILKVFEDESKYFQMCKNARQRFDENFEVSKVVKNQADWLESLFSKK